MAHGLCEPHNSAPVTNFMLIGFITGDLATTYCVIYQPASALSRMCLSVLPFFCFRLAILAQVGTENLKSTCELAIHASEVGADCIAVASPTYFKPPTVGKFPLFLYLATHPTASQRVECLFLLLDAMVLYLEAVARSVPDMPLYYYHNPPVTGVECEWYVYVHAVFVGVNCK